MPDSATMIHLGKQEDEAAVSLATAMPVGDLLPYGTGHPYGPPSHGSCGPRDGVGMLGAIIPQNHVDHLFLKDVFCMQPPKQRDCSPPG